MKKKIRVIINSKLSTFAIYSAVAVFFCWQNQNFPSIDGPAHFYNSFLLKEYFFGNEIIKTHFVLTPFYIPNLFSNYFIAALLAVFSFKHAALLFFFSYFLLFLYSARFVLKSYKINHATFFSLVFVVFFYSHLITLGFYNFTWSFVFLFYALGFYQFRARDSVPKNNFYVMFFVLSVFLYYTNALAFLFLLLFLFLDFLFSIRKINFKHWFKIVLSLLPTCVFLALFYFTKNPEYPDTKLSDYQALTNSLFNLDCLLNYNYPAENEKFYNKIILCEVAVLFLSTVYIKIKSRKRRFISGDYFFIVSVIMLMLYYFIPNNSSVGMMTARFLHSFYVFLILWLVLQDNVWVKYVTVFALFYTTLQKYYVTSSDALKTLNASAEEIIKASGVIKPNSSVSVFDYSEMWLQSHYSSYLGVEKPLVILDNPEAIVGWFPLKWNENKMPNYIINNRFQVWGYPMKSHEVKKPDYVFVYGYTEKFKKNPNYEEEIRNNYKLVYKTTSTSIEVYALYAKK